MNLALIHNFKKEGYAGKVALTATDSRRAAEFEKASANLVFRPFRDATEQAADALTDAMGFLPESIDWPVSFLEVRIRSDASAAGRTIEELPLSASGISILAVSRGGRIFYEPRPDFLMPRLHLTKGPAKMVIAPLAAKLRAHLIVMGTLVARTGISGVFIGNTAETILDQLTCSVLAIKPHGFETPVSVDR